MMYRFLITDGEKTVFAKGRAGSEFLAFWMGLRSWFILKPRRVTVITFKVPMSEDFLIRYDSMNRWVESL